MARALRPALFALNLLVGLTAGVGGLLVATQIDRFPPEWLTGTPFADYTLPGLILACVVGGSALLAAATLVWRPLWAGAASVVAGAILVGWIAGELMLLSKNGAETGPRSPVEAIYLAIGLAIMLLGAGYRRQRSRSSS